MKEYPPLESYAHKLTWYPWPENEADWPKNRHGLLIKVREHGDESISIIGDYSEDLYDGGCGCCACSTTPLAYAYIQELLPGNA